MTDLRWLLSHAASERRMLAVSVLSRILGHAASAALLALPAWTLGTVLTGARILPAVSILPALLGLALAAGTLRYLEQLTGHLAAFRLLGELRILVMQRLLPQAPAVTDADGAPRVLDVAVREVDRIEVFFAHTIAPALSAVLLPIAATTLTTATAGPATGATLALVLAAGWAIPFLGRGRDRAAARELGRLRSDLTQHVADSLRTREVILGAGTRTQRLAQMRQLDDDLGEALQDRARRAGLRHGMSTLRLWGGALLVLLVGLSSAGDALPAVLMAAALVPATTPGLDTLERLAVSLPAGLAATRRIRELTEAAPLVAEPGVPRELDTPGMRTPTSAAALDQVTFDYPGRPTPVLDGVDLQLAPGTTLGVTGPTGSGKSTIARLLQRHRDPRTGTVFLGDVDVRGLGSAQVQRVVAVADQEPFLLDATVEENLLLAAPDASEQDLQDALRAACSPLPLDRPIGRRGSALSGGERQRLALARTLLRASRAPGGLPGAVLVLDEATSHQDPLTQERLVTQIQETGASLVAIAHRPEALRGADQVIRLEDGRVVSSP